MLFSRTPSISVQEAAERLATREPVLVDVREPVEARSGRIPGACQIPLSQLRSRLDELDRHSRVAFLCQSGVRSARATKIARKAGYDASNVRGGMIAWKSTGLPISRRG